MIKRWLMGLVFIAGICGLTSGVTADEAVASPPANRPVERLLMSEYLLAQQQGEPGMMHGDMQRRTREERMQQRKHLEELRLLKMLELLDLSKDQEVPFLTAFNAMRERQRGIEDQINQNIDSLAREIDAGQASDQRLNYLIDRVKTLGIDRHENTMRFFDQARSLLTPVQAGKLIIFQKRFEVELLEQVGRFRRFMGPGGPPEGEG